MVNLTIFQLLNFNSFLGVLLYSWNNKSLNFIYGYRNNACILDLVFMFLIFKKFIFLLFDIILKKGDFFFWVIFFL